jgi:hypothetical protein
MPGPSAGTKMRGSCLCGAIRYEIDGEIGPIQYCHCRRCRKATGSAFNVGSTVPASGFRIVAGDGHLGRFLHTSGLERTFCRGCGSPIYSWWPKKAPELRRIRVGTLDTPVPGKVSAHIFAAHKAEWDEILDGAPQYAERP